MKKHTLIIHLLICSLTGFAQELANIPGVFLDVGYGARPMGLGGAYTAAANDAYSIIWNPAGLTQIQGQQASFYFTKQFNIIPYSMAVYANQPANSNWGHGEAVFVSGDDALRETMIYLGIGYKADRLLKGLKLGTAIKYKNASFGENPNGGEGQITGGAIGFGLDFGALYTIQEKFVAGISVKNVFDVVSWNSSSMGVYTQNSPVRLIGGMVFQISPHYLIAVDMEKSLFLDTTNRLNLGMERVLFDILSLRGGAFQNLEPSADMNYNFGIGINYSQHSILFLVDAAYVVQEIENSLRISFTIRF